MHVRCRRHNHKVIWSQGGVSKAEDEWSLVAHDTDKSSALSLASIAYPVGALSLHIVIDIGVHRDGATEHIAVASTDGAAVAHL